MGVYSTFYITRETALRIIRENIECATDRQLADTIFALFHEKILYNYIVGEKPEEECDPMWADTLCDE